MVLSSRTVRWELAVSVPCFDMEERLWPIKGSDSSEWGQHQRQSPTSPPQMLPTACETFFYVGARLLSLSEISSFQKVKAKVALTELMRG